jgi:DNA-nicking Smr family endonuclease
LRAVRIVHGKGNHSQQGPVLKRQIGHWLRQRGDVLAYVSARQTDGGAGALYVLLSR